eukprot:scaffold52611_cov48-Attheya_sp.AAC.1
MKKGRVPRSLTRGCKERARSLKRTNLKSLYARLLKIFAGEIGWTIADDVWMGHSSSVTSSLR